jgi:peptidoglycan hydrolase-like protein with peptidoglycan-binding domain
MEAEVAGSRRRVRAGVLATVLAALLLAAAGWASARGGLLDRPAAAPAAPEAPTGTAEVTRGDVVERQLVPGTLGYGDGFPVVAPAPGGAGGGSPAAGGQSQGGILTHLPAPGTVLARGRALYEVDGRPVPLWYGARPAWRAFHSGMADGPDVRQLEDNLVALGFDPGRAITVDRHYGRATAAAVRRWQRTAGLPRTGAVALGEVVFLPGPVRVATVVATTGGPLPAGTPVLTATPARPLVTVALDPNLQQLVRRGNRVLVTVTGSVSICECPLAGTPFRGSAPLLGLGSGVSGSRHPRAVLRSLARPPVRVGLPAVVTHERHRGGNSPPLDIPVGDGVADRPGPVTEIAGRVRVAVHDVSTPRAHPHPIAEPEVGEIAAAAVVGLRRREPAVGHHQFAAGPAALVGQGGTDPAEPSLGDGAPECPQAHPTAHRGDVEVLDDDGAVTTRQAGGEGVHRVGAEVRRPPVEGCQLGVRLAMPSGADDAAGSLPGDPAALEVGLRPWGGMRDAFDRVVIVGDDRPLGPDAKIDTAAPRWLAGRAGLLADDRLDGDKQPPAVLRQRHRQHPCAALGDQALQPPSVLLGPQPPDDRQDKMGVAPSQGPADQAARAGGCW